MASWYRTITSPFRKACTFFNHQQHRDKKSQQGGEQSIMDLQGEVMACTYEDVQLPMARDSSFGRDVTAAPAWTARCCRQRWDEFGTPTEVPPTLMCGDGSHSS
ncbi:Uncharacterized protein Fot_54539 [Forsythia ovata]|uniref:Uncharacterized protein n=1 Tax=Forsythia ovata TaxID=205694 RepID=A0ABD1P7E3_9LAMI